MSKERDITIVYIYLPEWNSLTAVSIENASSADFVVMFYKSELFK